MSSDRLLARTIDLQKPEEPTPRTPLYARSQWPEQFRVVLVSPPQVPRWINAFIRLANADTWIELSVLPVAAPPDNPPPSLPADLRALLAIERLRFRNAEGMLDSVPVDIAHQGTNLLGMAGNGVESLGPLLTAMRPDLVLTLGMAPPVESPSPDSGFGLWQLDASITDDKAAGIPLLAPVLRHEFATAIELELECEGGTTVSAEKSWGATKPGSFHLQREEAFKKMPALLLRVLRRFAGGRLDVPASHSAILRMVEPAGALGPFPGARALTIALPHTARWQWQKKLRSEEPWFVALRSDQTRLDPEAPSADAKKLVVSPKGTYWADPCAVGDGDRSFLFVEEFTTERKRGVIACIELLDNDRAVRIGVALDEPWHLSYPQPFNWEGKWYMTVESKAAQRVSLYVADAFPLGWTHFLDLVQGRRCVDPTLHHHDGHWYLFANASESGGSTWDELFLFVSEHLYGPFQPHPCNPILSDVRRARPAGRLFTHGGRLIRPSQDCARSYGAAIVFNEVMELSPTGYRERPLSRLDPSPGLDGCHTYNVTDGTEVIDARGAPPRSMPRVVVLDAGLGPVERG
jgi:hypothetical protein